MQIEVPGVITAGGTASLLFELTGSDNERLANMVNGTATMSLRKESTRRTRHELTHLPTTFEPTAARRCHGGDLTFSTVCRSRQSAKKRQNPFYAFSTLVVFVYLKVG